MWVLFNTEWTAIEDLNLPGDTLDIVNTVDEYIAYFTDTSTLIWTWITLAQINPNSSCKRILELGNQKLESSWNWSYTLEPFWSWSTMNVYCNMDDTGFSDVLAHDWFFETWADITKHSWWNEVNTAIVLKKTPVWNDYALHHTVSAWSQYEVRWLSPTDCRIWYTITMKAWTTDLTKSIFHHNVDSTVDYALWWSAFPLWKVLDTKIVDGVTWNLKSAGGIVTAQVDNFYWYMWYNGGSEAEDLFIDWVELSCVPGWE
jgi:hypothetical protein